MQPRTDAGVRLHVDSDDLLGERWYRLLAGVIGGVVAAFVAAFVAASVSVGGSAAAETWFFLATLGFGFVIGYWVTAAAYTSIARAAWLVGRARNVIPRARLLVRRSLRGTARDADRGQRRR